MRPVRKRVGVAAAALALSAGVGAGTGIAAYALTQDSSPPAPAASAAPAPVTVVTPAARTGGSVRSVSDIYAAAVPGVVEVQVSGRSASDLPFGGVQRTEAQGSGFVVDSAGHIVTNQHVVAGANRITVVFNDGTHATATAVGTDVSSDLAVLHVDVPAGTLHPLALGDSSALRVGDAVVAIGSPFGLENSASAGIVSALHRTIQATNGYTIAGVIQTDAAINHGSSGGPLLDSAGRVVGVTSQIEGGTVDGNVGVGFVIPSNMVRSVVDQLVAGKKVSHPYLGVELTTVGTASLQVPGVSEGAAVSVVRPGSPAAAAGLVAFGRGRTGDVIVAIDGVPVSSADDATSSVASKAPGQTVAITVVRGGARRTVTVALGTRPGG